MFFKMKFCQLLFGQVFNKIFLFSRFVILLSNSLSIFELFWVWIPSLEVNTKCLAWGRDLADPTATRKQLVALQKNSKTTLQV